MVSVPVSVDEENQLAAKSACDLILHVRLLTLSTFICNTVCIVELGKHAISMLYQEFVEGTYVWTTEAMFEMHD